MLIVCLSTHEHRRLWLCSEVCRTKFGKNPPMRNYIKDWYEKFQCDWCLCIAKRTSEERVESVEEAFQRCPRKTTNRASREDPGIPQSNLWRILCKCLWVTPYRLQLLQALTHDDKVHRLKFCTETQQHLEEDSFADKLILSNEATFNLRGKVKIQNVPIWGT
jgi:hypothetical protein